MSPLTAHRQSAAMTQTPVTAEVHQPLDVHGDLAPKIALDHIVAVDHLTNLTDLRFGELAHPPLRRNRDLLADLPGEGIANAVDISERYLDPLVGRDIHTCNSGHAVVSSRTANVLKSKPDYSIGTQRDRPRTGSTPGDRSVHFSMVRALM